MLIKLPLEKITNQCENLPVNGKETLQKAVDFVSGKKVAGDIAAVLPTQITFSQRYAVRTPDGIMDAHVPTIKYLIPFVPIYFPRPPLKIGEKIDERTTRLKPWTDGQTI